MSRRVLCFWFIPLALSILMSCRRPVSPPAVDEAVGPEWFVDVTSELGIDFSHDAGAVGAYFMPQVVGSGSAVFDFNNDGLLDLYFLSNGGPTGGTNRLYQQLPGGRFRDVSRQSGLDIAGHNMGVACADVNNDGWVDVLVTQYGGIRLFLNQGDGTFRDASKEAGLHDPLWAVSACFFDYDRDGWLDLVVVNYVDYDASWPCTSPGGQQDFCSPKVFAGTVTKMFRNTGRAAQAAEGTPSVRFEDVSFASHIGRLAGPGLGVLCADFDGDGWPDVLVANDGQPNRLWINRRDGTFADQAIARGLALNAMGQAEANMGIALGDVDGDGMFDVFVTHLTQESHRLWQQGPRGLFQDRTIRAGLSQSRWRGTGFGTVLADFDHDGRLDLAIVNGRVARGAAEPNPQLGPFWSEYAERNQLLRNDGAGRFLDVSAGNAAFSGQARVSRGLAVGDLDGDGALDLVVTAVAGPARVFRNVSQERGHWLLIRAFDPALRRDALGTEIVVHASGRRWLGLVQSAGSYLCSSDPRVHFGLGAAAHVDRIEVHWPSGSRESIPGGPVDRPITLEKGRGQPSAALPGDAK